MAKESTYARIGKTINDKKYFILTVVVLVFLPLIQGIALTFGNVVLLNIPIISDLYAELVKINLIGSNTFILRIFTLALIFAIFTASWDLLSGYTGQFNFGHALFFGFAAYFFYIFTNSDKIVGTQLNPFTKILVDLINSYMRLNPIQAFFVSALMSSILAFIIGLVALRLKGPYFALVSLILPIILYYAIINSNLHLLPGGEISIPNIPRILALTDPSNPLTDAMNFYYFTLAIFFISMAIMMFFGYSRFGDVFQSIREDDEAAESIGIDISKYKILAFVISAYFAGLAGNLYAQYQTAIYPTMFNTDNSFTVIIMAVIGGIGTIYGGAVGAILITLLIDLFVTNVFKLPGSDYLIYGLFLLIVVLYLPHGVTRAKREHKRALVLGILFSIVWILISHIDFSSLSLINQLVLLVLGILILPLIPFFIVAEQVGLLIFNDIFYLGLASDPVRTVRAIFLIDVSVAIPLAYYFPKIFKMVRLRLFGIWPSIGLYEPE